MPYFYLELPNPDMFYNEEYNKDKKEEKEIRCIVISMINEEDEEEITITK